MFYVFVGHGRRGSRRYYTGRDAPEGNKLVRCGDWLPRKGCWRGRSAGRRHARSLCAERGGVKAQGAECRHAETFDGEGRGRERCGAARRVRDLGIKRQVCWVGVRSVSA